MGKRLEAKELMDLASADVSLLLRTIRQFRPINFLFSSSRRLIRSYFFKRMESEPEREYTLLELGAGGGDIMVWAAREARRRGLRLKITCIDIDRRIMGYTGKAVRNYPEISLLCRSAFDLDDLSDFDFIFSNHFLHHLAWDDIEKIIGQAVKKTRIAFLFNDLKRSNMSYIVYAIFAALFLRRSFAFTDGLLSIRKGFLPEELKDFLRERFPEFIFPVLKTTPGRIFLFYQQENKRAGNS